jgi:hypothetical protein
VWKRLEQAVGDEKRRLGVVGCELVGEVLTPRSRNEIQPVERGVADPDGIRTQSRGEPQRLEEVEPLGVALRFVVAHDGEKRDVGVRQRPQHGERAQDVRQRGSAVVKQVAGVNDGVNAVVHRVGGHLPECVEKILASLAPVVLLVPQVCVPSVDDPSH